MLVTNIYHLTLAISGDTIGHIPAICQDESTKYYSKNLIEKLWTIKSILMCVCVLINNAIIV